ncbi:histidine phosphatase family protein [Flavobacterium sp. W21_SRS_FM6]|uniref:histidine phosphatase family protein n=1 Tax=Flavobacterium sp. W21_SRS_FM6 TaxID=3240268 RepID=UPI003F8EA2B8
MSLFLIRHGETNSNRDKIIQTPDTELSDLGHQQAYKLAQRFNMNDVEHILCSDYLRTKQTASPLIEALGCKISYSSLLRERNFGDIRGLSYDEVGHDFHQTDYRPVNGESIEQFSERTAQAWHYICEQSLNAKGHILVITHGLVLRELVKHQLNLTLHPNWRMAEYPNTSVIEVDLKDLKTVYLLCDTEHLDYEEINQGGVV